MAAKSPTTRTELIKLLEAFNEAHGLLTTALAHSSGAVAADVRGGLLELDRFARKVSGEGPVTLSGDDSPSPGSPPPGLPPFRNLGEAADFIEAHQLEAGVGGARNALRRAAQFAARALRRAAGPGRDLAKPAARSALVAVGVLVGGALGIRAGAGLLGMSPITLVLVALGALYLLKKG